MKLSITVDAYALTSQIRVEQIKLLKKYNPDALKIKDDDGNVEFAVSFVEGKPSVEKFGITFSGATRDEHGYATITGLIPADVKTTEAAKEFVAEHFGAVVAHLTKLEEQIPEAAKQVAEDRKKIVDSITVG